MRLRDGRGDVIEGPADDGFVSVADEAEGDMPLRPTRPPHAHELGPRQRLDLVEHRVGRPDRDEQALAQPISTRSSRRNRNRSISEIVANWRIWSRSPGRRSCDRFDRAVDSARPKKTVPTG